MVPLSIFLSKGRKTSEYDIGRNGLKESAHQFFLFKKIILF